MKLISRISPPQLGHASGNSSPTRASSFAQAIRDVSWWQGISSKPPAEPQQPLPDRSRDTGTFAGIRFPLRADVPDGKRRDGLPQGWFGANTP